MGASSLDAKPTASPLSGTKSGATAADATTEGPTLGALVASASRDLSGLVHSEVALLKAEVKDDIKHAAAGGGMFAAAAFLGFLASIVLSFALAYGIDTWLWRWLSFLIVGVLYLAVAGLLALIGKRQFTRVKPPEKTISSTKETVAVLKGAATK